MAGDSATSMPTLHFFAPFMPCWGLEIALWLLKTPCSLLSPVPEGLAGKQKAIFPSGTYCHLHSLHFSSISPLTYDQSLKALESNGIGISSGDIVCGIWWQWKEWGEYSCVAYGEEAKKRMVEENGNEHWTIWIIFKLCLQIRSCFFFLFYSIPLFSLS